MFDIHIYCDYNDSCLDWSEPVSFQFGLSSPFCFLALMNVLYELGLAVFTMFVVWSCEYLDEICLPDTASYLKHRC